MPPSLPHPRMGRLATRLRGIVEDQLPIFPSIGGAVLDKQNVVATIAAVARDIGHEAGELGRRVPEVTVAACHSVRVLCVRHLSTVGTELPKIRLMVRWETEAILRHGTAGRDRLRRP